MLTLQNLQNHWPNADARYPGLLEGMAASAAGVFDRYGLNSDLVIAHLMAQMSVETGNGTDMIEDLDAYSAQALLRVFPTHFNATTAAEYAHNGLMIGEIAYGGRLGNAPAPSTDGYVYRGAGLIQLTGKGSRVTLQTYLANHQATFDIVATPGALTDPAHALECAAAFFAMKGCIAYAQKDCGDYVSYLINGGTNGLAQRQQQLVVWKKELGVAPLATPGPCPPVPGLKPVHTVA